MRLSKLTILALRGTSREEKDALAAHLGTSAKSLYRWIDDNKDDGPLVAASGIIANIIGLPANSKLLTEGKPASKKETADPVESTMYSAAEDRADQEAQDLEDFETRRPAKQSTREKIRDAWPEE